MHAPLPAGTSRRRSFLGRLAAGGLALLSAPSVLRGSEPDAGLLQDTNDAWIGKLKGQHRQYFDATTVNDGFPLAYAFNWMGTMAKTYGLRDDQLSAVIGLRHFSIPIAFTDAIWSKYALGKVFNVTDPVTRQPSTRNIYLGSKAGDMMFPDAAVDKLVARGATVVVCNLALNVFSGMAAPNAGVSADAARAEWIAGLVPGAVVVPSGVLAVNRAQERGKCTYCYAG